MCLAVLVPEPFLRSHYRVRTSKPTYDFSKGKISPAGGGIFLSILSVHIQFMELVYRNLRKQIRKIRIRGESR
ncbi:hypothetical protein SAMN05518846_101114 [Brevibacillus centrosporus]|uniref:Uncharacterized protein n=1 Tax=Brevibacillus centrosporus TaxID=54910 RepID=A0A1I3KWU8_9BACL|nr:hypothetical protein SAMN05518846_101114 [Brevibacillus centrosporus]